MIIIQNGNQNNTELTTRIFNGMAITEGSEYILELMFWGTSNKLIIHVVKELFKGTSQLKNYNFLYAAYFSGLGSRSMTRSRT